MRLTIKARLFGGFALVLILMVISVVLAMDKLADVDKMLTQIVRGSAHEVKLADRINQGLLEITRAEKNLILADNVEQKETYAAYIDRVEKEMENHRQELKELSDENGKAMLDNFAGAWQEYLTVHKQVRELAFLNSNVKAEQLSEHEAKEAYDRASAAIAAIVADNDREAAGAVDMADLKHIAEKAKLAERINRNLVELQRGEKNMILASTQADKEPSPNPWKRSGKNLEDPVEDPGNARLGRRTSRTQEIQGAIRAVSWPPRQGHGSRPGKRR